MKLQYIHKGLQFFFVTVALEGRPQVLSRLVEGEKRPTLTPLGEVVKASSLDFAIQNDLTGGKQ